MELLVYYLLFCGATALGLVAAGRRHSSRRYWELTPETILVISFFIYSSAMPVSRAFWGTSAAELDIPFMQNNVLAAVGLAAGLAAGKLLNPPKARANRFRPMPTVRCAILAASALFFFLGYMYYSVGFNFANIFKPYGFESSLNPTASTATTLVYPVVFALILHCYLGAFTLRNERPWLHRFVLAMALLVALFCLTRGQRNPAQILWLPIIAISFQNRRIPVLKSAVGILIVFVAFSMVAVIRNYGLLSGGNADLNTSTVDPGNGELGTSYNVFRIFSSMPEDGLRYGGTYTVDLGLNLVPLAVWPDRPPSTAVRFSMRYFQTDNLTEGLGYSPVIEALTNFPQGGLPIVFGAFAFGVVALANYLRSKGRRGLLCYFMMLPMIVNWNRIDSNASFKMFVVYGGFLIILDWFLYRRAIDAGTLVRPLMVSSDGPGSTGRFQVR